MALMYTFRFFLRKTTARRKKSSNIDGGIPRQGFQILVLVLVVLVLVLIDGELGRTFPRRH